MGRSANPVSVCGGHAGKVLFRDHAWDVYDDPSLGERAEGSFGEEDREEGVGHESSSIVSTERSSNGPKALRSATRSATQRRCECSGCASASTTPTSWPAESAAIFLQQLGRGLRRTVGKDVLDFVGQQRKEFRFDLRYRQMLGRSRRHLVADIDQGFP